MKKRRARLGEGLLAQKVKDLIEKDGHIVKFFSFSEGAWRHYTMDVMSWEVYLSPKEFVEQGIDSVKGYGCWENMTNFYKKAKKFGFELDHSFPNTEIWAKDE